MCIEIQKTDTFKKAKRDIICYKIVYKVSNGIYISIVQYFEYVIRQLYTNKTPQIQKNNYYMTVPNMMESNNLFSYHKYFSKHLFHSYRDILIVREVLNKIKSPSWYKNKFNIKYIKCLIPKGAYYVENRREYASSQIKILEEI